MTIELNTLPADVGLLQELVCGLAGRVREQDEEIARLKHDLAVLRRYQFGRRSEKADPGQLLLGFAQLGGQEPPGPVEPRRPEDKPKGHGRQRLPEHLPRERVEHALPADEQRCGKCGEVLEKIGEEVTEQLDYVPASFVVRQHVRVKYACRKGCQENVVLAPLPAQPIEKGLPGPGLLAHVAVSKYADHLPLYRLGNIFKRHGVDLSRSTLCGWVGWGATLLEPIVEAMRREVLASMVIHTDDTPVRVQDPACKGTRQGRLWVYVGDAAHPYTLFDYTPTRERQGPMAWLDGFSGYLQADAFSGYDAIYASEDVIEVACWAHARRKFHDAQSSDAERAPVALAYIAQLYAVEREARDLDAEARRERRQQFARPILNQFRAWLDAQAPAVVPKSPMGEAVGYTLSQWTALTRYLDDGHLAIDNNVAEQALRPVAIGRKNWLFAGSDAGGRWAAILYSIMATCKRHDVDPFAYVRDVLDRVATHPSSAIAALFPPNWKAAQQPTDTQPPTPSQTPPDPADDPARRREPPAPP